MKANYDLKLRSFILAAALLAGFGFVTHAGAQESAYYLIDLGSRTATKLGSLGGGDTTATAINDAGQVVGNSKTTEGITHAFITGPGGVDMRDLGSFWVPYLPGSDYSFASDINNAGQVVGVSALPVRGQSAFITGPDGVGMRALETLEGEGSIVHPSGINDAGQVTGSSDGRRLGLRAFITGPDGVGVRDLGTLGGGFSDATGINDAGQVVGVTASATLPGERAFITGPNGVGMTDIGNLGINYSYAHGINDIGQVVGESGHAFITGPNGVGMTDLGTLGGNYSSAYAINDAGQVVGLSRTSGAGDHAFITGPDGEGMIDLNSLVGLPQGTILTYAIDINNAGQVLAIGVIPEPEIYAMLLAGLGLVGFMARRKKAESLI